MSTDKCLFNAEEQLIELSSQCFCSISRDNNEVQRFFQHVKQLPDAYNVTRASFIEQSDFFHSFD